MYILYIVFVMVIMFKNFQPQNRCIHIVYIMWISWCFWIFSPDAAACTQLLTELAKRLWLLESGNPCDLTRSQYLSVVTLLCQAGDTQSPALSQRIGEVAKMYITRTEAGDNNSVRVSQVVYITQCTTVSALV